MPPATPPKLHSQLVVDRYPGGHVGSFPCGMPNAIKPSLRAWADYATGCMKPVRGRRSAATVIPGRERARTVVDSFLPCPEGTGTTSSNSDLVGRQRLELWTRGLKVRCSTN